MHILNTGSTFVALFVLGSLLWLASGNAGASGLGLSGNVLFAKEAKGVVKVRSNLSFNETVEKLEAAIKANSALKIVAKIDHSANAKGAGVELRPTVLFIFGNPRMGTPLMAAAQTVALDLPQKMIVFEDDRGSVFVAYNDSAFIAERHGIDANHPAVKIAKTGLSNLAKSATIKEEEGQ